MAITTTKDEDLAISNHIYQRDVITRLIALVNDLESRIETLENA